MRYFAAIRSVSFLISVREEIHSSVRVDSAASIIPGGFDELRSFSVDNFRGFRMVETDFLGGNPNERS